MSDPPVKSEIANAYDEWAATYDTNFNRTRELAAKALRQVDLNVSERRIIEAGCGTGYNTVWLAESAESIVALDFSGGMLEKARERLANSATGSRVTFIKHDVRQPWPVANASADIIVSMLILEHLEHLEPFFREASRALDEGGELFICELHPLRQLEGGQAQFTRLETGERQLVTAYLHHTHDFHAAAVAAGFQLTDQMDWHDPDAEPDSTPRILTMRFRC